MRSTYNQQPIQRTVGKRIPRESQPRAQYVQFTDDELIVVLTDGRKLFVPLAWFPRLVNASVQQRAQYELLGDGSGIRWPAIDEDISVLGLLIGGLSV